MIKSNHKERHIHFMRIKNHPVLEFKQNEEIAFTFEGKSVKGIKGDTIASALSALGILTLGHSIKRNRPRGFYCAIGNCASCNMIVNGVPNVRTCITSLEENMDVWRQSDKGVIK
jgi:succinate dehydrogenase/fumarate reductase-like Fe-S protein